MINGFDFFIYFFSSLFLYFFFIISSLPRDEISVTEWLGCQRLLLCSAAAVRYDNDDDDINDDACLRG